MGSLKNQKALSTILLLIIVVAVVVVGAVAIYVLFGPGELVTEEMEHSGFTVVDASSAFQVEITQSSSYSVVITADKAIFDEINVSKTGKTLIIDVEAKLNRSYVLKAEITMPNLDELALSGASKGKIEGFSSSNTFVTRVSGASRLEIQNMNVGNVEIELSGASELIAEGSGNDLTSIVDGASDLDLTNFPVNDADFIVSGASDVTINLDGILNANLSGASTLQYIGDPTMGDIETSGASTINKK